MFSFVRKVVFRGEVRNLSSSSEKWDLVSAVSLERLPVITRELKDVETRFMAFLNQVEKERSHKSNFELRREADKKRAKELEKGAELDLDSQPQQTAQDFLDASTEELQNFKFAKRLGSPDVENDTKSTLRAKDRRLLLLVKDKFGSQPDSKPLWLLPQGKHQGEPSLRATAERVLAEKCGPNLQVKWLGNAPAGFYKFKYPKVLRKETVGAKIFFFKAQLLNGSVDATKCQDFQWATRNELNSLHEDYRKSVASFLIDEEH
uniref:Large ribosomal subunit protein mL46 n=1 Tax=Lygus hesperus TaxID=30085 RepID=A0A0A9W4P4_LYGHE